MYLHESGSRSLDHNVRNEQLDFWGFLEDVDGILQGVGCAVRVCQNQIFEA